MEPTTTSAMVGAVVGYLAQQLKNNKSINDFFGNFSDASVKWIRPLFLKENNQPQALLENLSKNPESLPRQAAVTSALEVALEDHPQAKSLLREMYETIKTKGEAISIVNSKNVVIGNTIYADNVNIGDNNVEEIMKSTLGGDGIAVISFVFNINKNPFRMQLYIQNLGNFPIYDVIVTQNEHDANGNLIENKYIRMNIGNIAPKNLIPIGDFFDVPKTGILSYSFTVLSRNGTFFQRLETRWPSNGARLLSSASRVEKYNYKNAKYEIVYEQFDPFFPEDEKSKIIWNPSRTNKVQEGLKTL